MENRANRISSSCELKSYMLRVSWEFLQDDAKRACVCLYVLPVRSVNQSVNRHLWAAGHLAPTQLPRREERNCWPPHTHTDEQNIATHRHANIHKHTDPLDNTNSHKHISLGSHRRQTLPCLLPCRKLSQEGARDQHLSFSLLCVSPSLFCYFQTSLHQHFAQFICPKQQPAGFIALQI